jgi:sugar/nucleoside kinase (ribokinase family)
MVTRTNNPVPHDLSYCDVPEIIGFGALNVDYIATASRLSQRMAERITESTARFEWNREGPVDQKTIADAIKNLGAASLGYSLGGSAWLTIFALAQMRVDLRLGYVGVVGRIEAPGLSFLGQMEELGIDHRWVDQRADMSSGVCLSYIDDTDRVMLTHPGANFEMGGHIQRNFNSIARYLAEARYVHLTSFLDDHTPAEVLRVLIAAKKLNPTMQLSFDPGFDWAEHPSAAVRGILALTDLLFVNYREFKAIGRYAYGEPDDAIASKALERCARGCNIFVTKRYDFVEVFRAGSAGLHGQQFQMPRPVRETEVEDATGAGDVFAAAVLASLASQRLKVELGACLGLSLARYKMQRRKPARGSVLPDLSSGFLQRTEAAPVAAVPPGGVFIVHDESPHLQTVKEFLTHACRLPVYELSSLRLNGANVTESMREHVARCSFAVCLLSTRKTMVGKQAQTDQNIVYQAGLFQGRYGFGRVALLVEEGCDTFSNIAGLIRMDFPYGQVDSTFIELERMLKREGLMWRGGKDD